MIQPTKIYPEYSKFRLLTEMDRQERLGNQEEVKYLAEYAIWREGKKYWD